MPELTPPALVTHPASEPAIALLEKGVQAARFVQKLAVDQARLVDAAPPGSVFAADLGCWVTAESLAARQAFERVQQAAG